jgi:hypothetical protein
VRAALPVLALLSLATAAAADPPPGTIMKVTPPGPNATAPDPARFCVMQFERNVAMLGQLEKALALTDRQKPLFDTWKKTRVEVMHTFPCPLPQTGLDVPTPTRLEREENVLNFQLDAMHKERPLVSALYDALSPDQRAIFDRPPRALPAGAEKAKP